MDKKYIITGLAVIIMLGGLIILLPKQTFQETGKIKVTTSFYPLYFFATEIGQDNADITNITPAGAEPHDYEPTAQDLANIETSNLLILNGGGLEPWADNVKNNRDNKKTVILTLGDGLTNQQVEEEGEKITDPHIWLSPPLAYQMVSRITQGFVQIDPDNKNAYENNAHELLSKLDTLDKEYKEGLANCAQKSIVTSHAAFGYLAKAYGLNQIAISGLSPDAEPSPKQLADVATFVKTNNVKYIFFESLVSPKLSNTIATETGAQTLELNPIEGLDDQELLAGQNYFTKMENNLTNLKVALQCK